MSRDEAKMLLLEPNDDQTEDLTTTNDAVHRNKYKTERDEFILCIYEYWKLKRLKFVCFDKTKKIKKNKFFF